MQSPPTPASNPEQRLDHACGDHRTNPNPMRVESLEKKTLIGIDRKLQVSQLFNVRMQELLHRPSYSVVSSISTMVYVRSDEFIKQETWLVQSSTKQRRNVETPSEHLFPTLGYHSTATHKQRRSVGLPSEHLFPTFGYRRTARESKGKAWGRPLSTSSPLWVIMEQLQPCKGKMWCRHLSTTSPLL